MALNLDQARFDLQQYQFEEPNNLSSVYLENYLDFFTLFIREDKAAYEQLEANKDKRLELIRSGDRNSPYYLLTQAEILLQWALIRFKFADNFTGFLEINQAIGLLKKNEILYPNFFENKKSLSLLHALIGTIPDNYRYALSFISNIEGDINLALSEIDEVIKYAEQNEAYLFRDEAYAIKAYILADLLHRESEALNLLDHAHFNSDLNPLKRFIYASIAHKSGKNDLAIETLEVLYQSQGIVKLPYLSFMLGYYKLCRLDLDAGQYILAYANEFDGRNYIKEAFQKVAWYNLVIRDSPSKYRDAMQACMEKGAAITDEDKYALEDAKSGLIPDKSLLKARLLFDGGYYERARQVLIQVNSSTLSPYSKGEWNYRMGRTHQELKMHQEAIQYFTYVLLDSNMEKSFMACNSALQIGFIYESKTNKEKARQYYEQCLNFRPKEYRRSLHQKAKAALLRINEENQ
jgi:predicted negative regulator of RcsB-dependent stress response